MEKNFHDALRAVLKHEGGWADHPKDPGGATMKGVTLSTYRRLVKPRATKDDLRNISDAEIATVYRRHYWDVVRGNELPSGLDYAMFDFAVNSGPKRAIRFVQRVTKVPVDGRIGPVTLNAIDSFSPSDLTIQLCEQRLKFLKKLKTWSTFGKGWSRRVAGVKKMALSMAEYGPDSDPRPVMAPHTQVSYANQNAIRNLPVTANLENKIGEAVATVFGAGYRAEIYSGGQPPKGKGRRTGSVRHDYGRAADICVYDPQNNRVTGECLAPLGQYWLAKKNGACGMIMNGGGVHLDEWTTPPRGGGMYWTYAASDRHAYGLVIKKALQDGHKGLMPKLAAKPLKVSPEVGVAVVTIIALVASWWQEISTFIKGLFEW